MQPKPVAVLAGGVGAARFLLGVLDVMPGASITVIGNVGDDLEHCGLRISPDLDTVLYTLAGAIDEERGWGVRNDSTRALDTARALGLEAWFWLGDVDIGLHLARTAWLGEGLSLSTATGRLAASMGLTVRLLPCTDDRLRTMLSTDDGVLSFQEYFVRRGHRDAVRAVDFDGAESAMPAPGVVEALGEASLIVLAPSNPLLSIGPILAVNGIRAALRGRSARCVAVSPIVAGAAIKGPAADMLRSLGHEVSPVGVADLYSGLLDVMVIDNADAQHAERIESLGIEVVVTDTVMRDAAARACLARAVLGAARVPTA